jgi:tetratricopeptide (TPR) repeat protein
MKRLAAALVVAVAALAARSEDEVSLWRVDRQIAERLDDGADVSALADSVAKAEKTTDGAELLHRFLVEVRAGHDARAAAAIDDLRLAKPPLPTRAVADTADFLIDRRDRPLATRLLERFPDAEPGHGHALLDSWAHEASWKEADAWAAARPPSVYWLRARLSMRQKFGEAGALNESLVADAKAHPDDVARFERLLEIRGELSDSGLAWAADVFRPRRAFDAAWFGMRLGGRPAVVLLERALTMPITADDLDAARAYAMRNATGRRVQDDDFWRAWLVVSLRDALVRAYQNVRDVQKAQELLAALAHERAKNPALPTTSLFLAGKSQSGAGARTVEARIRDAENEDRDSPEYWRGRAHHFQGRGDKARELDALDHALALTPLVDGAGKGGAWVRWSLVFRRAALLDRAQGYAYLREEAERTPDDFAMAAEALGKLADDYRDLIAPDDPRLWRHLAATAEWGVLQADILLVLAERSAPLKAGDFWTRAEALARGAAPSRCAVLGAVARGRDDVERAEKLFAEVVERLPDGEAREAASHSLLEAARDLGHWKRAEAAWPLARRQLSSRDMHGRLGDLAVAQAKAGAVDAAMRTWARAVNLDRGDPGRLNELAAAGLRERLAAFYRDLLKRDPAAEGAVRRAMGVLGE